MSFDKFVIKVNIGMTEVGGTPRWHAKADANNVHDGVRVLTGYWNTGNTLQEAVANALELIDLEWLGRNAEEVTTDDFAIE